MQHQSHSDARLDLSKEVGGTFTHSLHTVARSAPTIALVVPPTRRLVTTAGGMPRSPCDCSDVALLVGLIALVISALVAVLIRCSSKHAQRAAEERSPLANVGSTTSHVEATQLPMDLSNAAQSPTTATTPVPHAKAHSAAPSPDQYSTALDRAQWAILYGEAFFKIFTVDTLQRAIHKCDLRATGKKDVLIAHCLILYGAGLISPRDFSSNSQKLSAVPPMP